MKKVSAVQIELECFGIDRRGLVQSPLLRGQFKADLVCNGARDLRLYGEHVSQVAIVSLRPEMGLVADLNKLCGNANSVARSPHAALQNILNAQILADLRKGATGALVPHS